MQPGRLKKDSRTPQCRTPVKIIAIFARFAASMISVSRMEPPGLYHHCYLLHEMAATIRATLAPAPISSSCFSGAISGNCLGASMKNIHERI